MPNRSRRRNPSEWTGAGKSCPLWNVVPCVRVSGDDTDAAMLCGRCLTIARGESLALSSPHSGHLQVFNIVSGVAKSYKTLPDGRRQIVSFHFPGDLLLLVPQGEFDTPVLEAIIRTTLCHTSGKLLQRIQAMRPEVLLRLLSCLAREQGAGVNRMLRLGCLSAEARLASFLTEMLQRIGGRGTAQDTISLPMDRQDIADYLAINAETVSRAFTKLKRAGVLVAPQPNRIVVRDREQLLMLAGLDNGPSATGPGLFGAL